MILCLPREEWGTKIIDQLAKEIKFDFPEFEFVQERLAQIPWYYNITLLDKVKNVDERT